MFIVPTFLAALAAYSPASERTLTTANYTVTITERCSEYEVGCQKVQYHSVSRHGKSINLMGTQEMAMCKDGVTPCHALGYRFINGRVTYSVSEDGELSVRRGTKILVDERGNWSGE